MIEWVSGSISLLFMKYFAPIFHIAGFQEAWIYYLRIISQIWNILSICWIFLSTFRNVFVWNLKTIKIQICSTKLRNKINEAKCCSCRNSWDWYAYSPTQFTQFLRFNSQGLVQYLIKMQIFEESHGYRRHQKLQSRIIMILPGLKRFSFFK